MTTKIREQNSHTIIEAGEQYTTVTQSNVVETLVTTLVGPPGQDASVNEYIHNQAVPSASWVITHGLTSVKPHVTVVDSSKDKVFGNVTYTDDNTVTITFSSAFSGVARLL